MRSAVMFVVRVIGAIVTGLATLFTMKADPSEHWSIPPTVTLRVDHRSGSASTDD